MKRHELEEKLEQIIHDSGVDLEEVIDTLEMMLDRYREELEGGMTKRRILARVENQEDAFPELDWIRSRTGILGESFSMAVRSIQDLIEDGSMIVVREEDVP